MSTITLTKVSHKHPEKFRANYEKARLVLDENEQPKIKPNNLPIKKSHSQITIIGGGFGGLGVALTSINKLNCDDFVLFEKHDDLGGTWYANTYPGCASDIPALWYSYYGELVTNWSDLRPPQYEMEEYVQRIVAKYNIRDKTRTLTIIVLVAFNDDTEQWVVEGFNLETGQRIEHTTKIIANCTGGLVVPNKYNVPGLDNFEGNYMHSGIWDWSVDFKDKKVVVIGNGCSASQVVPALLDMGPQYITQSVRSKHWIFPPHPHGMQNLYESLSRWRIGLVLVRMFVSLVAEMRYPMYTGNGYISRFVRWMNTRISLGYMKSTIPEKYHDILIPDFKIGCKRLIFDYRYAPSLQDPRINVVGQEIVQVKPHSVFFADGTEVEADIIVACTGYNLEKSFSPYQIYGKNGIDISKYWKVNGISAYETILVRDCPNYFAIAGPNCITGHSSVILAIENACAYFSKVAAKILNGTYSTVCVKNSKYEEWFETTQRLLKKSVFGTAFGGCVSWYSKTRVNSTSFPYSQINYYFRMRNVKWQDLDVVKNKSN